MQIPEPKFNIGNDVQFKGGAGAKFRVGLRLYNPLAGWYYSDSSIHTMFREHELELRIICPFKPGDRIACKSMPEKVGRVAENYDILIDLSAPKDVAGQVIPSHIVVWSAWAPAPKYELPLAIKHKLFPDNIGYADKVVWDQDRWEYHGPEISGTFEENVIDLNDKISKLRTATALNMEIGNQKIIELFLGEYK